MRILLAQVDAFTAEPYRGNPAAVCLLSEPAAAAWMQAVAAEMNLSETAFVEPRGEGFGLRWFTPAVEVDLCGHATLASAHVLWEDGLLDPAEQARFHTLSGLLTARRDGSWIELDFTATRETAAPAPEGLAEALGTEPVYTGKNAFDYIVELESEETVRALRPRISPISRFDFPLAIQSSTSDSRCVSEKCWRSVSSSDLRCSAERRKRCSSAPIVPRKDN